MAHGDYNCCALCDCKMDYNAWEATTKKEICGECLDVIKDFGLNITNVEELTSYIEVEEYDKVKELLIKCGFSFCFYWNDVDMLVWYRFFRKRGNFKDLLEKESDK